MGIHGLMKLISEEAPGALKEKNMENLNDRKVAIDASMAIYQFMIAVRSNGPGGNQAAAMLTNEAGEVTSHIQGMFNRTIKMMESGVRPAYVFDGKPPQLKGGELAKRLAKREKAESDLAAAKEAGEVDDVEKFSKRLVKVTRQHNEDCKELLRLMGIPCITAPCEAEAQCAELAKKGKVFATATEDMDSLTFRTPKLLRRFTFSQGKDKLPIIEVDFNAVLEGLQLTYEEFVDLCILCGCDYCNTIKGIGPKTALKLIRQYHTLENVVKVLRRERKYEIPDDWKTQKIPKNIPKQEPAAATAAAEDQENMPANNTQPAKDEGASAEDETKPCANPDVATVVAADSNSTVSATAGAGSEEEEEDGNAPEAKADLEADVDLDAGADLLSADVNAIAADEEEAPVTLAEGEDEEFEIIPPLYAQARKLFLQAEVTPGDEVELKWEEPKEDELKKFLVDRMGFNPERVQNGINKLQAAFRKKSQKRMDSFFTSLGTVQSSTSLNNKRKAEEAAKVGGGKKGKPAPAAKKGGAAFGKKR